MKKTARAPAVAATEPAVREPLLIELKFSTLLRDPLAVVSSLHLSLVLPAPLLPLLPLLLLLLSRLRLGAPLLLPRVDVRHEGAADGKSDGVSLGKSDGAYVGGGLLGGARMPGLVVGIADVSSWLELSAAMPPLLLIPLARTRGTKDMMVRATKERKEKVFIVFLLLVGVFGDEDDR